MPWRWLDLVMGFVVGVFWGKAASHLRDLKGWPVPEPWRKASILMLAMVVSFLSTLLVERCCGVRR